MNIEPLQRADADRLFAGLQDQRLYEFIDDTPPPSLDWLRARFSALVAGAPPDEGEAWLNWIVTVDAEPVGTLQATIPHDGTPTSIAYVFLAPCWSRGLARTAVRWLIDELAEVHGVTTVQAEIHEGNLRSLRLVQALDFVHVDTVVEGDHLELIYRRSDHESTGLRTSR